MLNNNRKRWTNKEDERLIALYGVKTYKEIGQELSRTRDAVESRIRKLKEEGKVINDRPYKTREMKFKERFETMYPDFKYHSEYKNADKPFKSECKICGYIQERNGQCTRPKFKGTTLTCDNCNEIRRKENEFQKQKELKQKEEQLIRERLIKIFKNRIESIERENLLQKICTRCGEGYKAYRKDNIYCPKCIELARQETREREKLWRGKRINCAECGEEFEMKSYKSQWCSKECMDKSLHRLKEIRRNERMQRNGRIDYSITIAKLIKRDEGICKICGEKVDTKDYTIDSNRNFIVGERYPSIDHIIPVSKGGTHTWNNVQLAHHQCNSIKNDNVYKGIEEGGQLRII